MPGRVHRLVPGRGGNVGIGAGAAVGVAVGAGVGVAVATAAGFFVDALAEACTEPTVLAPTAKTAARKRLESVRIFTTGTPV
jgi:hypothetical protein